MSLRRRDGCDAEQLATTARARCQLGGIRSRFDDLDPVGLQCVMSGEPVLRPGAGGNEGCGGRKRGSFHGAGFGAVVRPLGQRHMHEHH